MSEFKLREQLINSSMNSLKIDNNPFNYQTIKEFIEHIKDEDLKKFYSKLFGSEHSYLNGMDRISKVAEQFKPKEVEQLEDTITAEANRLINLAHSMYGGVYKVHLESGANFDELMNNVKFPTVSTEDINILDNIRAFDGVYGYKHLISNLNHYGNTLECLKAFKTALKYYGSDDNRIENKSFKRLEVKK